MVRKITCCPHCGSKEGFFTRTDYIGVPYQHGYNGEELDNGEMYDKALEYRTRRYAYCISCEKPIGTARQMMKQLKSSV